MLDKPIVSKYRHIDNGGITVEVDEIGNVEVSCGYFGYSNSSIFLTACRPSVENDTLLDFLIQTLIEARSMLNKCSVKNK